MLSFNDVEDVLEELKLRLLIQEKSTLAGAGIMEVLVIHRNEQRLILIPCNGPMKDFPIEGVFKQSNIWFLWKKRRKMYVQHIHEDEVIPLQIGEIDAFIDLMLK